MLSIETQPRQQWQNTDYINHLFSKYIPTAVLLNCTYKSFIFANRVFFCVCVQSVGAWKNLINYHAVSELVFLCHIFFLLRKLPVLNEVLIMLTAQSEVHKDTFIY